MKRNLIEFIKYAIVGGIAALFDMGANYLFLYYVFNSDKNASEYILNFSLPGFRSEIILNFLSSRGICVSAGSACAKGKPSHVMSAVSSDKGITDSAIRLSFSHLNTKEEIDMLTKELKTAVGTLAH